MRASSSGARVRYFERFGALRLVEAATLEEALTFFDAMKELHCASWERRGRPHSFSGGFFEPFHRLLIERSFAEGGTQLLKACAGDRVLGYLYNFRLGYRVYAYQSGFDDADRRSGLGLSPISWRSGTPSDRAHGCMISWPAAIV